MRARDRAKKTSPLFGDYIEEHKSVMHIQENASTLDIVVICKDRLSLVSLPAKALTGLLSG